MLRRLFISLCLGASLAACGVVAGDAPVRDPRLDALFAELADAPDAQGAHAVEERIWARWRESGSATVDILLERASAAENAGDATLATEFLDQASELAPHFAEPWNRRAMIAYDARDYAGAISAIQETLRREPRHFGALTGLALIYEGLGRERAALEAYRAVLAIHPHFGEARQGVQRLTPRVDGRDV